ncbi:hypothetical protein LSH36_47g07022 [Paralvinella palmiformis]|uniref:Nucleotide-diphospho-sugar transferase domain-containing protein n=1 Tax=Paralvinella palmiformis TaxID=53620 RepID=A0AAD9K6A1_9ANNE|nr:hypothetical protein LSH36_47g07022 [Paralvinella palmiformis]
MVEMAMNFYFSSIVKFNITNLIYISVDHESCDYVMARRADVNFRCHVFREDDEHVNVTRFDSSGVFARRTNIKPLAAYAILSRGYEVLITDLDIVYLKNPISYIKRLCKESDCDMAIQMDVHEYNSGFLYARPTTPTMAVYNRTLQWCNMIQAGDQECYNRAIKELRNSTAPSIAKLKPDEFPSGKYAFPGQSCPSESVLNEDCLLWDYDGVDGYYSNDRRRYVTYAEPVYSESMTPALLNLFAIGVILNRTAILPKVNGPGGKHIRNSWLIFKSKTYQRGAFDKATGNNYRFGNFLRHRLVPNEVKSSLSAVYCFDTDCYHGDNDTIILASSNPDMELTVQDIKDWFGPEQCSVLRLEVCNKRYNNLDHESILSRDLYNILVYKHLDV